MPTPVWERGLKKLKENIKPSQFPPLLFLALHVSAECPLTEAAQKRAIRGEKCDRGSVDPSLAKSPGLCFLSILEALQISMFYP